MIVDEGGGYMEQFGSAFATPGVAEKGSTNVQVQVNTPGGHSSVPPAHTGIGILSRLLVEFEEKPFAVHLVCLSFLLSTSLLTPPRRIEALSLSSCSSASPNMR